ncbi:MAG: Ig-like domain-containing protein [Thermoguttaceae bacterium]|nr:Ig-like domain-containing protein [Thermoguttaceae bacterium]
MSFSRFWQPPRCVRRNARRLGIEPLEDRKLLAVDFLTCTVAPASDPPLVELAETPAENAPPVAVDDAYTIRGNQQLGADVLANDSDPEGAVLSAVLVDGPTHGTLTFNPDGLFVYAPADGFEGEDLFTYRASDGQAESALATVRIAVAAAQANAAPEADDDAFDAVEDQVLSVAGPGVLANDGDPEGGGLRAILTSGPRHGTLVLGSDGAFEYTPAPNFYGTDSFVYRVSDGAVQSDPATATITVAAVNDAPIAADESFATLENQPIVVGTAGVLDNDTDADGDPLSAVLVDEPDHGTLVLNADGSFEYTPQSGFSGVDAFSYVANDGQADSNVATVTIEIAAPDPAPADLAITIEVTDSPFGDGAGPIWGGSTFWVSAYVEDLREVPLGVVGGAIDLEYDAGAVAPTGQVVYGPRFTHFQQGQADPAAGVIDEAGALTTEAGAGVGQRAAFIAWQFRRAGPGAPDDPNGRVVFVVDPGEGTGTITPASFALVGQGTEVDWARVQLGAAEVDLVLGDFNGNGAVNHFDLALWIPHAMSSEGDPGYDPEFDLNADARVDLDDLALLLPRLYQPAMPQATPPLVSSAVPGLDLGWIEPMASRSQASLARAEDAAADRLFAQWAS